MNKNTKKENYILKKNYEKPSFQIISSIKGYAQAWCGKGRKGFLCNVGG
ncbi:MAG: hypothetical protein LBS28_03660 [Streptococcaceae bacterium]|jgi:hypothetical protein|nr:hypothetical protein [Streptococcaceae bacterium]